MRVHHRESDLENHDRGLDYDLPRLLQRRGHAEAGRRSRSGRDRADHPRGLRVRRRRPPTASPQARPAPSGAPSGRHRPADRPAAAGRRRATETSDTANGELPEETAGPYPGDGSNGANVLTESGVVRSDITSSFGSSTTKAEGVPLTITMTINDFANDKKPLAGAAVYLWHCDREGRYSLYSQGVTERELPARRAGDRRRRARCRFTTIFPACYAGRWPHIHFEVYPSLAKATNSTQQDRHLADGAARGGRARRCTRPPATSRACRTSARSPWTPTTSSATATTCRSRRSPATPTSGYHLTVHLRGLI